MLVWRIVAGVLSCVAASACGANSVALQADQGQHTLVVEHAYEAGPFGGAYVEGALSEVLVTDRAGTTRTVTGPVDVPLIVDGLEPGTYTVEPGLRPCSGHCEVALGARTDTCAVTVQVPETSRIHVRYTATQPCTVTAQPTGDPTATAAPAEHPPTDPPASGDPFLLQDPPDVPAAGHARTWDSARTDGDRALLVSFLGAAAGSGPCETDYTGTARIDGDNVVVTVAATEPKGDARSSESGAWRACDAIGHVRTVRIESPVPLAGRTVVDGKTGRPGVLFDDAALPRAAAAPAGYDAEPRQGGSAGDSPTWTTTYSAGPGNPVVMIHYTRSTSSFARRGGTVVAETEVRGHNATVYEQRDGDEVVIREVGWHEPGGYVLVQSALTRVDNARPLLTTDELVAFARSFDQARSTGDLPRREPTTSVTDGRTPPR